MAAARRILLIAGVASFIALGWLGFSWARDSSLVKVRHVRISGLTTSEAPAIRKALTRSAEEMTTLHVDTKALELAVHRYPVVRSVSASGKFPSTLEITVHEYRPSAVVTDSSGRHVAVAQDGTLLPRVSRADLPSIKVTNVSTSGRVSDPRSLTIVDLLGDVPQGLRSKLDHAYWGVGGVRVALRDGPTIDFGSPSNALAKWRAAARVLADSSSVGARVIDVRLPSRPVAAGFAPGTAGTATALPPEQAPGAVAPDATQADPTAQAAPVNPQPTLEPSPSL